MPAFESGMELDLLVHYREMDKISGPWDWVRLNRLCALLHISKNEFARLVRLTPNRVSMYMDRQVMPGCLRLLFDLVEQSAHQKYLGRDKTHTLIPEL